MAEMSFFMREAPDLNATLENEVARLRAIVEEEKKKADEVKAEVVVETEKCSRTVKRLGDLREAAEAREDGLSKIINDFEAKVKTQVENDLNLNSTISKLHKGEGVIWRWPST